MCEYCVNENVVQKLYTGLWNSGFADGGCFGFGS